MYCQISISVQLDNGKTLTLSPWSILVLNKFQSSGFWFFGSQRCFLSLNEKIEQKKVRFRTLGCYPLTAAVESDATTVEEIIIELLESKYSERQGRLIDNDQIGSMEKKKQEGYF